MNRIVDSFRHSINLFLGYAPGIFGGIVCFILTLVVARFLAKIGSAYSLRRTHDSLIATFIGKIVWSFIFIIGCVVTLGILGLGSVSNKILAGAGITTFIIGFALKDIGENFLAGLILAFSRPYREGSLIECDGIKGIVRSMTMRQTTVEAENGRIILIPNASIIKQPLIKYMESDLDMRQEFSLSVEPHNARKAVDIISDTISEFKYVRSDEHKNVKVLVDNLQGDRAKLNVIFWFDTAKFEGSRSGTKSEIMLQVFDKLRIADIKYSG